MNPQELEELWKEVKKDAKEHPESYFKPHQTLWDLGVKARLKRLMNRIVIFDKRKIKKQQISYFKKCSKCEGKGQIIIASAIPLHKNGRVYSRVKKDITYCDKCDGKGYD